MGTCRTPDSWRSHVPTPVRATSQSTDAIVLLKNDHREVKRLFAGFQKLGDGAEKTKQRPVDQIIELLTVRTYIENKVRYPRVRELLPELEDDILGSYEEHHVADVLVAELAAMSATDERFTAKTTVIIESVTHHIDEEERDGFPKVRDGFGRKALQEVGRELLAAKMNTEAPDAAQRPQEDDRCRHLGTEGTMSRRPAREARSTAAERIAS
jgi:hemerythrin superfamily protein